MVEPPPRLTLNADTVRSLVSPTGDGLVHALQKKRYQRTLLGISQIHKRLLREAPTLLNDTGFSKAVELLRTCPGEQQERLLTYPSVPFWVDVAEDLLRRESHIRFPEMHFTTHLEAFWRVLLAAGTITVLPHFACSTRTDASGRLSLPGAGFCLQLPRGFEYFRVQVVSAAGAISLLDADECPVPVSKVDIPKIGDIELNSLDGDLRLPGRTGFDYQDLDESGVIKWQSPIHQSLEWISNCAPLLFHEMRQAIRCIVPVCSPGLNTHTSATFREAPGLMALSWTPDAAIMVEAMVHEYHHNKLNTLLVLDRLIVGPTDEAVFYSPWRPDPRPLLGIFHGAFVFQAVLEFWQRFFEAGMPLLHEERTRQRMYLIQSQTRQAFETLEREAILSNFGAALLDAMKQNLEQFDTTLPQGLHATQHRINRVQQEHRAKWEMAHAASVDKSHREEPNQQTQADHPILTEALGRIGYGHQVDLSSLSGTLPVADLLLEKLVAIYRDSGLNEIEQIIPDTQEPLPPSLNLLAGHVFYVTGQFMRSAFFYARLTQQIPASPYFWQCFAFAARHIGYLREGSEILTNLGRIASRAQSSNETGSSLLERLTQAKQALAGEDIEGP